MPKGTEYKIEWSSLRHGYEVIHGAFRFEVTSSEWLGYWIEVIDSFHFCSPTGHTLTLRKERKQRGAGYWYAYKHVDGHVQKKYLGDRSKLDLEALEMLARQFVEPAPPPPPPPRVPTLKFSKTLESALEVYGFSSVPNRRALIDRYRQLSKQHHPDTGGLHEDMVAVNLAYDYLKRFL